MNVNDYEHRPKVDFKDTVNLPIAIPAWGLLVLIAGGIYLGGITVNKLNTVIDNSAKSDARIAVIADKQADGVADVRILKASVDDMKLSVTDLKSRVGVLELRRK